jgi:CDP-diacylglycerol--glycerol-3-phosphate 3-phosphatidyltransferase
VLIARGALLAGGLVTLIASALDMLDGALARATGTAAPTGALTDSVLDRVSEAVVLGGVLAYALNRGQDELALLAFIAVVGSLLVSYVRARAEGLGVTLTDGLFTRAERVVVLSAALVFGLLRPALWLLAVLTVLTAAQRLVLAYRKVQALTAGPGPDDRNGGAAKPR